MKSFRSVWLLMVALFIVSSLVVSGPAQAPGTILWKIHSGGQFFFSSAAVGSDGTIYVGSWNGQLLALDPSGTQKWAFKTNGPIFSSQLLALTAQYTSARSTKKSMRSSPMGCSNGALLPEMESTLPQP
jgi:glucose dehydrogenase